MSEPEDWKEQTDNPSDGQDSEQEVPPEDLN